MDRRKRKLFVAVLVLTAGFAAGTAAPEAFRMGTGNYTGFFSLYSFGKYGAMEMEPLSLLPAVLSVRLKTLLFLWMSSYTAAGLLFHLAYGGWLAASAGMLLALFALRGGIRGLALFACCLFPQWIVYGEVCRREMRFLLSRPATAAGRHGLAALAQMVGLAVFGSACEAFLGTWTLKIYLRMFK